MLIKFSSCKVIWNFIIVIEPIAKPGMASIDYPYVLIRSMVSEMVSLLNLLPRRRTS